RPAHASRSSPRSPKSARRGRRRCSDAPWRTSPIRKSAKRSARRSTAPDRLTRRAAGRAALLLRARVESDDLFLREDVTARHEPELRVRRRFVDAELVLIERVHREMVVVRGIVGRRTRPAILALAEVGEALRRVDARPFLAAGARF